MKFHSVISTLIALNALTPQVLAVSSTQKLRRRLQNKPCVLLFKHVMTGPESSEEHVDCFDPQTDQYLQIANDNGAEKDLIKMFRANKIFSGQSTIQQNGAYIENNSLHINNVGNAQFGIDTAANNRGRGRGRTIGRRLSAIGDKEMLAIKVDAPDSDTSSTEAFISDSWFGTNGDTVNFKSQMEACSYDSFTVTPATTSDTGLNFDTDGVYTVSIQQNVNGVDDSTVRNAVVTQAELDLGNLRNQYDHVMLCLPPGTSGGWIAYAYINWYLSVYNDNWCNYPSAQMHGKKPVNFYFIVINDSHMYPVSYLGMIQKLDITLDSVIVGKALRTMTNQEW